jgi:hypothetical protein
MKKLNALLTASALLLATSAQANAAQNVRHLQVAYNLENSVTVASNRPGSGNYRTVEELLKGEAKKKAKKRLRRLAEEEYNEPESVAQRAEWKRITAEYHAEQQKKWEKETDPAIQKMFAERERKNRKVNKRREKTAAKNSKKRRIRLLMKKIKKEEKEYDEKMKKAAEKAADARRGRK